ncbi:hypothetical protein N825_25380 [Skermanella stibiiresistens SB22]|uniref:Capsid protein n=1 Tax=Skermanella stibiiresistens SB22 TaxID=1385369 RepID=W9GSP1_9PROT|nr:major capsid protein [Skermanella stibiiresistens]EWY36769.1 hypothetical protein N825_25380 [Skermanella stibiiresistens SB22]
MADLFSTSFLSRVVEHLDQPASFILDTFFPSEQTSDGAEEIAFDIDKSKPRLTPFVHPTRAGRVVEGQGYESKSFRPAYAKDKRRFDPRAPLKRAIGEQIGGVLTPMQRRQRQIGQALADQLTMLTRREEAMAAEALTTGKVTVKGEDYPTVVVDFGRDAALTSSLADGQRWGQEGVKALDTIEETSALIQSKSGAVARTVVLDPLAWRLMRNDPQIEKYLDLRRVERVSLDVSPMARGQGKDKARYVGSVGDFDIWVYQDVYVDENDAGVLTEYKMLPDFSMTLASASQLEGVRAYGAIHDEEADFMAARYFTKSWLEKDPAVRWLLLQSAPLVFPYRPNASACVTVAAAP